jgi:anti-sigma factor RsiW
VSPDQDDTERLHRYLLGRLSAAEDDAVEAAYLAGDEAFRRLLAAEEELIDAYVAGALSEADRRRFEEHFLASPARRERVAFARALARLPPAETSSAAATQAPAAPTRPRPRHLAWPGLAAALMLALLGSAGLLIRSRALSTELARARAEQEAAAERSRLADRRTAELLTQVGRLSEELAQTRSTAAGAVVVAVLAPGLEREGARPSLRLPPRSETVRLRLLLEEDSHTRYAATLQTPDGDVLASVRGLPSGPAPKGRAVDLALPAAVLADGTYVVELKGITRGGGTEGVASYQLRVLRTPTAAP